MKKEMNTILQLEYNQLQKPKSHQLRRIAIVMGLILSSTIGHQAFSQVNTIAQSVALPPFHTPADARAEVNRIAARMVEQQKQLSSTLEALKSVNGGTGISQTANRFHLISEIEAQRKAYVGLVEEMALAKARVSAAKDQNFEAPHKEIVPKPSPSGLAISETQRANLLRTADEHIARAESELASGRSSIGNHLRSLSVRRVRSLPANSIRTEAQRPAIPAVADEPKRLIVSTSAPAAAPVASEPSRIVIAPSAPTSRIAIPSAAETGRFGSNSVRAAGVGLVLGAGMIVSAGVKAAESASTSTTTSMKSTGRR